MGKRRNLQKIFEEQNFRVTLSTQDGVPCAELETWTEAGVNMIHFMNPFTLREFERIVDDFDVDTEVDFYRLDQMYKDTFRVTESVKDFEAYHARLKDTLALCKEKNNG